MNEIEQLIAIAKQILEADPDPAVRYLLLRDVLRLEPTNERLAAARAGLGQSRWVQLLKKEQEDDGGWGRFHSRDSRNPKKIITTEVGVARALALGLDAVHPVLQATLRYLVALLEERLAFPDPREANDRWPTGVRLFTASTLANIQPDHPTLDQEWSLWAALAERIFASGHYSAEEEIRAHHELTGAMVADSYLVFSNRYTVALMAARAHELPPQVEAALIEWLWKKDDGLGYFGVPLNRPPERSAPTQLELWLCSLELLVNFPSLKKWAEGAICWLWNQQGEDGLWDFGPRSSVSWTFPLSESWRKPANRAYDYTTRVLALMGRYHLEER